MSVISEIRFKKLKDMTDKELSINRQYTIELLKNTENQRTRIQESKYLEKIDKEIRKREYERK